MSQTGPQFPPHVSHELAGWTLFWADIVLSQKVDDRIMGVLREVEKRVRARHVPEKLAEHPTAAGVRKLFRQAGCDPTRYRPSSEALMRRIFKGEELPSIHPFVDLNNCLSVELVVPSCVMAYASISPPFVLRQGAPGEQMLSLRGPFDLSGKPVLADEKGPFGTPITDSERVRVVASTTRAWLVAYLPSGVVDVAAARNSLNGLVQHIPCFEVMAISSSS